MLTLNPKELPIPKLHQYLLGAIGPRPIAFASTVDENGNPIVRPDVPATDRGVSDEELVTVTGVPAVDPKGILVGRSVKPAPLPVDPSQPSPKGILMQRKPKTAPATVE